MSTCQIPFVFLVPLERPDLLDNIDDGDTQCILEYCTENQHVVNFNCVECVPGSTNSSGDDPSRAFNTTCDITYCLEKWYVSNNECVGCAPVVPTYRVMRQRAWILFRKFVISPIV